MQTSRPLLTLLLLFLSVTVGGRAAHAAPLAPTPAAPANGAAVVVPVTISWSAVTDPAGIIGYNWQVSRSSSFTPLVLGDSTNPSTTNDTVSGLTAGTYFWRVQAVSVVAQGAWSTTRSFNVTGVGPGTPGTPVLAPTRGYSTFHPWEAIHFDWTAVPDAVTYRLEVSNDPGFPVGDVPPGTTTFWNDNIPTNADGYVHTMVGNWFARVFAVDADNPQEGVRSLPSNVIQFSCFFDNPIGPPPVLLSPVDNPTLTLPVPLVWAHVPNPQAMGYVLEIARDPGFSDIEWFFNQYTEPTQEMLSLTSGPKFWRVLSQHGLSSPTTNANTDWSSTGRFTISSAPATPVSIAPLGNPQMVLYSGGFGMIAVQLTAGVPPGGATLSLASSHPALAPVPATISMPGTHAWTQFPMDVGQVTSSTIVTLTATLNGVSASSQLTVRPPTLNDDILQSVVRATGGQTLSGWVNLEGGGVAGPAGFVVNLSSDSATATVPATVTIPAGVGGTSFPIETSPVTSTTVVNITASQGAVITRWQITLTAEPAPTSLVVRPMSTTNGSQGVVLTAEGVGHDQIVQASSSNPALASVPGSVTVSAVSGIGFFDITTAAVTSPTEVTIRVSGGGVTLSHPLTLYPDLPALTAPTVSPDTVVGGNPATGTVTLAGPAPAVGVAINLASSLPGTASVPLSVTIPGGATSASFPVTTFPSFDTSVQLSAQMDNVFLSTAISVTQSAPGPTLSTVTVNPSTVIGGSSSSGTVSLTAPAPSGGAVVSLSDNSTAGATPSSVTVPAGATASNFTVTTTSVTSATTATISATYAGVTRTATLAVNPPPLTAPSLVSPAEGATPAQPVILDWNSVTGATSYEVQVDDTATIAAPFIASSTVTASQATVSSLPAQRLWWRVRAINAGGTGPFSATQSFTPQAVAAPPGFQSPTTNAADSGGDGNGLETSPSNAHGDDTLSAADNNSGSGTSTSCTSSQKDKHRFYNYGFSIPAGESITGIEVRLDARADSTGGAPRVCVQLSWDGGTTWTAAKATGTLGTSMATFTLGSASDTWGRTWSASNLTNASFRLRVIDVSSSISRDFFLDWVGVRVHSGALAPATLSALSLSPATVVGVNPSTGTVTLTAAAPTGGAVVSLGSSNTTAATVPASVTVAAGATSATFTVTTITVTASTPVTITGDFGGATRTATLTVNPVPAAPSLSAVTMSPTSVTSGASSTGTVTLTSAAPAGGAVVTLSDDSTAATVPASVTVVAGATSATFTVTTSTVTVSTPVTITGSFGGATRTATLTVNPAGAAVTLTVTASGRSGERITSNPVGINVAVGSTGSAGFASGSAVTLSVTNGRDAIWSGACSSGGNKTRTCTFTIGGNASVNGNVQ